MVETQSEIVYCQPVKPNYIRQIASKANSADATANVAEEFSSSFHFSSSRPRRTGLSESTLSGMGLPSVHRSCITLHRFHRYAELVSAKWSPFSLARSGANQRTTFYPSSLLLALKSYVHSFGLVYFAESGVSTLSLEAMFDPPLATFLSFLFNST